MMDITVGTMTIGDIVTAMIGDIAAGDHCRDVTIREWRGDDVVVRRERRCE
jgi:hypothetical protein